MGHTWARPPGRTVLASSLGRPWVSPGAPRSDPQGGLSLSPCVRPGTLSPRRPRIAPASPPSRPGLTLAQGPWVRPPGWTVFMSPPGCPRVTPRSDPLAGLSLCHLCPLGHPRYRLSSCYPRIISLYCSWGNPRVPRVGPGSDPEDGISLLPPGHPRSAPGSDCSCVTLWLSPEHPWVRPQDGLSVSPPRCLHVGPQSCLSLGRPWVAPRSTYLN